MKKIEEPKVMKHLTASESDKERAKDRIIRARVGLNDTNPFFAYIGLSLKYSDNTERTETMSVDIKGNLKYNTNFVNQLSKEELTGVICHEILHIAYLHLLRLGSRQMDVWNISADLCVNSMLIRNHFQLKQNIEIDTGSKKVKGKSCIPNYSDEFKLNQGKIVIKDISKKTAEIIYAELEKKLPKSFTYSFGQGKSGQDKNKGKDGQGEGQDGENPMPFDKHEFGDKDSKMTEEEREKAREGWTNKLIEASVYAKQRGKLPLGMERFIEGLHSHKVNWRTLLQRVITSSLPVDYSWRMPSKKSIAVGTYMPITHKEKVDVCVAIDTSGSIGSSELGDFVSEMIGISKIFPNADFRIICADASVCSDEIIKNGTKEKLKNIKVKGGGGTSHKPVFKLTDKVKNAKLLICFTDGYSDIEEINLDKYRFGKVFVITNRGKEPKLKGKGTIIKLTENS